MTEQQKNQQLIDCGYATKEEVEEEVANNEIEHMKEDEHSIKEEDKPTENAQKALNAILGKEEFKGLSESRKQDEFITALCGK